MKKYVEKQVIRQVIENIVCNKCGENIKKEWTGIEPIFVDHQSFKLLFGWGSKYDGLKMEFDLCDDCMVEIIESFKIKPEEMISFFGE